MGKATFTCQQCGSNFESSGKEPKYCSYKCRGIALDAKLHETKECKHCGEPSLARNLHRHEKVCLSYNRTCKMCQKDFRVNNTTRRNTFCSQSCSTTYNNSRRKSGIRRSKLEFFIEAQLLASYPDLKIRFNSITDMGFELDVYIPELNLAFEINGIVHYKNIYGQEKYLRIKTNDRNKIVKCHEHDIALIVLDTMEQRTFTEKSSMVYLDTICKVIDLTLAKKEKPS